MGGSCKTDLGFFLNTGLGIWYFLSFSALASNIKAYLNPSTLSFLSFCYFFSNLILSLSSAFWICKSRSSSSIINYVKALSIFSFWVKVTFKSLLTGASYIFFLLKWLDPWRFFKACYSFVITFKSLPTGGKLSVEYKGPLLILGFNTFFGFFGFFSASYNI